MDTILILAGSLLSFMAVVQLLLLGRKLSLESAGDVTSAVREEFRSSRAESSEEFRRLREESATAQRTSAESISKSVADLGELQKQAIDGVEKRVRTLADSNERRLEQLRETLDTQMHQLRQGNKESFGHIQENLEKALEELRKAQHKDMEAVAQRVKDLSDGNESRLGQLRNTVDQNLQKLHESNDKKLEQMRATVDEKLQSTLEKRLGESFKLVSDQLAAVQRGLGDMQSLATGVGDLKRVLTNVKTRGTWGEYQIGDILEQLLSPDQYQKNVQPKPHSSEVVEYAIRLPGKDNDTPVWLPIDAKFPQEDYQRLMDACEAADTDAVEKSTAALVRAIQSAAKDISVKYIEPPHTTDFAIMFLPTEGLYAEVLRQPGMLETLQHQHRVVVAGPTTLSAILNSLRMGFRTLAIEKRSSEVWEVLSAVKTEFSKFGGVLNKLKKQLGTAANTIDQTSVRTRAMERKLKSVEALPEEDATSLLGLDVDDLVENQAVSEA